MYFERHCNGRKYLALHLLERERERENTEKIDNEKDEKTLRLTSVAM